jgi:hypothetical protein
MLVRFRSWHSPQGKDNNRVQTMPGKDPRPAPLRSVRTVFRQEWLARRSGTHENERQSRKAKTEIIITTQIVALALLLAALGNSFGAEPAKVSADEALKRLIQGNARFVAGHMTHVAPEHVASARRAVAKGPNAFCRDCRIHASDPRSYSIKAWVISLSSAPLEK